MGIENPEEFVNDASSTPENDSTPALAVTEEPTPEVSDAAEEIPTAEIDESDEPSDEVEIAAPISELTDREKRVAAQEARGNRHLIEHEFAQTQAEIYAAYNAEVDRLTEARDKSLAESRKVRDDALYAGL